MTKKGKTLIGIVAAILVVLTIMMILAPKHHYASNVGTVVEVRGGEATPNSAQTVLTVAQAGTYQIHANWWMDEMPGFVTGLIVTDESGNRVFTVTGGMLSADSQPMELQAGRYLFRFEPLTSEGRYREYAAENFPGEEIGDVDAGLFRDGTWEMRYEISIEECLGNAYLIGMICGVVIGLLLVALVVVALRKEDAPAKKYDERQIAAQGMGYRCGFFTLIVYTAVMMFCNGMGLELPLEVSLQCFIGIILGAAVLVTILIRKDAYFRLDENQKGWKLYFSGLAVVNLAFGILSIARGEAVKDGLVTFKGTANLLCAVILVYLLIVMLVKSVKDREEE